MADTILLVDRNPLVRDMAGLYSHRKMTNMKPSYDIYMLILLEAANAIVSVNISLVTVYTHKRERYLHIPRANGIQ